MIKYMPLSTGSRATSGGRACMPPDSTDKPRRTSKNALGAIRKRASGMVLPLAMAICVLLSSLAAWTYIHPASISQRSSLLEQAASQINAQALIKGFSRPEETGSLSCPDVDSDGLSDYCGSATETTSSGQTATRVKVSAGQLLLAPGLSQSVAVRPLLTISNAMSAGNDLSLMPTGTSDIPAWTLSTSGIGESPHSGAFSVQRVQSRSESTHAVQERLKATFLSHLQISASSQRQKLTPDWAFSETLHLSHQADSAGTRFWPVNSGCQCACTRTRCKCSCYETSTWESSGNCVSASDAGSCQQVSSSTSPLLSRCTATPGKYCYLGAETWLAKRWAVSLYTPRATEGRACRPERVDTCPLTPKTGTTCTCAFDWPKPLSTERLAKLRLQFDAGQPRAVMNP